MSEIQVVFKCGASRPLEPSVSAPTLVANEGDTIAWEFYPCDQRIRFAQIEFENPGNHFFKQGYGGSALKAENKKGPHEFTRDLASTRIIYGVVPGFASQVPVAAKYTVRGLDSDQKTLCELDPEIVVNEP